MPDKTSTSFFPGDWFRPFDVGYLDEDGFLFNGGRADGAIMRGGFKLLPESIERALKGQPKVDAVISGAKTATHPFAGGADKS